MESNNSTSEDDLSTINRNGNNQILTTQTEHTALIDCDSVNDYRIHFKGLMCMLLSTVGFSLSSLFVKFSTIEYPIMQVVLSRSLIQFLFGFLFCIIYKKNLFVHSVNSIKLNCLLILRGTLGAFGLGIFYYTISTLTLSEATVIFFTSPILTAIFSRIVLNEPFRRFDAICSILCFGGVVLAIQPFEFTHNIDNKFKYEKLIVSVIGLLGATLAAFAYITVRYIGKEVHYMIHVVYFGAVSGMVSIFGLIFVQNPVALGFNKPTLCLMLTGVCATVGQVFLNKGLQICKAGPATLVRNLDIVFAYIYDMLLFKETPNIISILGSSLIISCVFARVVREKI